MKNNIALITGGLGFIGLNFVENFEDPMNRRSKLVRLTNKGKNFFSKFN